MSSFHNPVKIFFDENGVQHLKTVLNQANAQRVLILAWNLDKVKTEKLLSLYSSTNHTEKMWLEFNQSNPDLHDLMELSKRVQNYPFDFVIAIGGGSVIDLAKALIALQHTTFETIAELREIITTNYYQKITSSLLAIPTTSGTGSEVTPWATVWDNEYNKKYSINDQQLMAKYALILPELTMNLPVMTTVSTALDALCHATEAYWSKQSNPVSRALSLRAIQLIIDQLERPHFGGNDLNQKRQLAIGSVLAGLSFSNTRTTACHAISYPLTLKYNIPHGIAVGLTLGKMLEINQHEIIELDSLLAAFKVEKAEEVHTKLTTIYEAFQIPSQLHDYNIAIDEIREIASKSFTKGRTDNNPVDLSEQDIENVLHSIY